MHQKQPETQDVFLEKKYSSYLFSLVRLPFAIFNKTNKSWRLHVMRVILSCDQQLYRSLCWSVRKNSPLPVDHSFHPRRMKSGIKVKCVWEGVCLFSCQLAKRGHGNGSFLFKNGMSLPKRYSKKVGHEPRDSWLTVQAKRGRGSGCGQEKIEKRCLAAVQTNTLFALIFRTYF